MKFVKTAALIMSLSIAGAVLCACNNQVDPVSSDINVISSQSQNNGGATEATVDSGYIDANASNSNYKFTFKGVDLICNTAMDDSKFAAEDFEVRETASCAGQGFALEYTFKGGSFTVVTHPIDGQDAITEIHIYDDTVSTVEGIFIGNTVDQVKAVYGEPAETTDGALIYSKGSSEIIFYIDAGTGTVNEIGYFGKI